MTEEDPSNVCDKNCSRIGIGCSVCSHLSSVSSNVASLMISYGVCKSELDTKLLLFKEEWDKRFNTDKHGARMNCLNERVW